MDSVIVCYSKCWPCMFGDHLDPPKPHTWMDDEDAEAKGLSWPLTPEQAAENPCGCYCTGEPAPTGGGA